MAIETGERMVILGKAVKGNEMSGNVNSYEAFELSNAIATTIFKVGESQFTSTDDN